MVIRFGEQCWCGKYEGLHVTIVVDLEANGNLSKLLAC